MRKRIKNKKTQARKFYFQNCLNANSEYQVDGVKKLITLPYQHFTDIPKPYRYYVGQLIKHWSFNIQYTLIPLPAPKAPVQQPEPVNVKIAPAENEFSNQLTLL